MQILCIFHIFHPYFQYSKSVKHQLLLLHISWCGSSCATVRLGKLPLCVMYSIVLHYFNVFYYQYCVLQPSSGNPSPKIHVQCNFNLSHTETCIHIFTYTCPSHTHTHTHTRTYIHTHTQVHTHKRMCISSHYMHAWYRMAC